MSANVETFTSTNHLAIAVARYLEIDPLSLFDTRYSVRVYNKTYARPLIPVPIQDLTPDESIKPPILKKQAGRPKTKRIRNGSWEKKQTRATALNGAIISVGVQVSQCQVEGVRGLVIG
jgi:hypothetical protein